MNAFQAREVWPPGTVGDRKFVIHSTLGRGGFGTVYRTNRGVLGQRLRDQMAPQPVRGGSRVYQQIR